MKFHESDSMEKRLSIMGEMSGRFLSRAHEVDIAGGFPFTNIQELKDAGYTSLTVPERLGGKGISLYELIRLQEKIAEGDGATSLSIGWHMGIIYHLTEKKTWDESIFHSLCKQVLSGSLINSAATEPGTGSPTRGGRPETTAEKRNKHWVLNGRKTFTTMAPVLDYFIVSASLKDSNEIANFLVPRISNGVEIEETWDSIALRGTGSHDLVLNGVMVPEEYLVEKINLKDKQVNGWLLHIPACYLGIAKAARGYAIDFAKHYTPNSLNGPIIELPTILEKIGEIELSLMQAEYFLYGIAKQWDIAVKAEREKMGPAIAAAKLTVTNVAIRVVDLSMRIVGAKSLSQQNPLQRYYRDVRAGLHNPPMDDMTIQLLAKQCILNH